MSSFWRVAAWSGRARWGVVLAGAVALAAAGGFFAYGHRGGGGPPRAVIIDQLASTDPNPAFVREATHLLEGAGYRVDYVPAKDVTVDFYRDLPLHGYRFLLLRSHSYGNRGFRDPVTGALRALRQVGLFTTEPYTTTAHVELQARSVVDVGLYNGAPGPTFGIAPGFVTADMRGRFDGATLLLMGCDGLSTPTLASAFQARGVRRFIGWDSDVTAQHTDAATMALLRALLVEHQSAVAAVAKVAASAGPDPVYGGRLRLFP